MIKKSEVMRADKLAALPYKTLAFDEKWKQHMADVQENFVGLVYGQPGGGKTSYCLQMAEQMTKYGEVAWFSFEQKFDADLRRQINMIVSPEAKKKMFVYNLEPTINIADGYKPNMDYGYFKKIEEILDQHKSPKFIIIDSIDVPLNLSVHQYLTLIHKYGKRKAFVFIAHDKDGVPITAAGRVIKNLCSFAIPVKDFIAYSKKSRVGSGDFVVYEKGAREKNPYHPLFFNPDGDDDDPQPKRRKTKSKKQKAPTPSRRPLLPEEME